MSKEFKIGEEVWSILHYKRELKNPMRMIVNGITTEEYFRPINYKNHPTDFEKVKTTIKKLYDVFIFDYEFGVIQRRKVTGNFLFSTKEDAISFAEDYYRKKDWKKNPTCEFNKRVPQQTCDEDCDFEIECSSLWCKENPF